MGPNGQQQFSPCGVQLRDRSTIKHRSMTNWMALRQMLSKKWTTMATAAHVAGIAAGNGSSSISGYVGVAPQADIVFVKTTFYDTDIIDGITYITQKAAAAGKPFVINLSLGRKMARMMEPIRWKQTSMKFLRTPGRAVVVAAGNEGADRDPCGYFPFRRTVPLPIKFSIPTYTPSERCTE